MVFRKHFCTKSLTVQPTTQQTPNNTPITFVQQNFNDQNQLTENHHNYSIKDSKYSINIIEGWPIQKLWKITSGDHDVKNYSDKGKHDVVTKLWNFIKEKDLHHQFISELQSQDYVIMTTDEFNNVKQEERVKGPKQHHTDLREISENYSLREKGLYLSQNGLDKKRKGETLESVQEMNDRLNSQPSKPQGLPNYFTDEVKDMVFKAIEEAMREHKDFFKVNKSKIADDIKKQLPDTYEYRKIKSSLTHPKKGYYVSLIYREKTGISLSQLFEKSKKRRAYKRSSLGLPIHFMTQKTKAKLIHDAMIYGLNHSDEDIKDMVHHRLTYIGDIIEDINGNHTLIRDIRTVMCIILAKIYESNGFKVKEGTYIVEIVHLCRMCFRVL
ncbi:hypothetical protein FDP41_010075 [Naegleria fowleri]|uniref:Uncharacterized protein n=1 Tax=Naegleria fowleri TaxID=5763 RepID=A0A6A5B9M7_NAEFO|nr:uncharacterized protein FDP41_010075 [Naegleria fowleri]KAF0971852.1 hypothetical protein FDP41_010075 [Naegleria fowleri]